VHPPLPVVDAYRDVSRAESDRLRKVADGQTYRMARLTTAEGMASSTIQKAEADRNGRTARASGEADGFLARLGARKSSPVLTDQRLYWAAIAEAFAGKEKVILEPSSSRRQLFLPDFPGVSVPLLMPGHSGSAPDPTVSNKMGAP
jgi:regulator of protease activity HflC (stomatin/prohibitin superfamily)